MIKLAFYKGRHKLFDKIVQFITKSKYSHTEILLYDYGNSYYLCASSSFLDRGVRLKIIKISDQNWDILRWDHTDTSSVFDWYLKRIGMKYDLLGLIGVQLPFIGHNKNRCFCSESNAEALGVPDPQRCSPIILYNYVLLHGVFK